MFGLADMGFPERGLVACLLFSDDSLTCDEASLLLSLQLLNGVNIKKSEFTPTNEFLKVIDGFPEWKNGPSLDYYTFSTPYNDELIMHVFGPEILTFTDLFSKKPRWSILHRGY